jgi:hypothetical protein
MAFGELVDIGDTAIRDLADLAENHSHIAAIIATASQPPFPEKFSDVYRRASESTGLPVQKVRSVVVALTNLEHIRVRMRTDADKFLEIITASIDRRSAPAWSKEVRAKWVEAINDIADGLKALNNNNPLVILEKSSELTYAHQNILQESRIVTDIRPVFSPDGESVTRAVIIHTLLIEYSDGPDRRKMEFALDAADVAELLKACERAEFKATALKAALKPMPWQVIIPREEQARKGCEDGKD